MTFGNNGVLLIQAGESRIALRLGDVLEVFGPTQVFPVPRTIAALRGVTLLRERLVPLIHLGALLSDEPCPAECSGTAVGLRVEGTAVALEVDEADAAPDLEILPAPLGLMEAWATGAVKNEAGWIPLLSPEVIADRVRLTERIG